MSESGQGRTRKHASDVDQLVVRIRNLDEQSTKELVTRLMADVFYGPAKKVAFVEAIKSASGEIEQELVGEAVRNAGTLEARKTAVTKAVETARDDQAEKEIIVAAVKSADSLEAKKAAAVQAVKTADDSAEEGILAGAVENASTLKARKTAVATAVKTATEENEAVLVAEAVESTSTLGAKMTAATKAVESADNGGKLEIATGAANAVGDPQAQEQLVAKLQSELENLPKMIGQMIAWAGVIIVVVILLTLYMGARGQLSDIEIFVTIAIAVISTLAGYSFGAASLLSRSVPKFRELLHKGLDRDK